MKWYKFSKAISYLESLEEGWPEGTVRSKYGGEQQILTRISLDQLKPTPSNLMYENRIQEYVKNPPSVVPEVTRKDEGFVVEDGNHTIEAAKRRGESDILAWLGDRPPWEGGEPLSKHDTDDVEAMEKNRLRQQEQREGLTRTRWHKTAMEPIRDVPEVLFHATYLPLMKDIKEIGLGLGSTKNWEGSKSGVVYLARDPFVAESYAETSENVPEEWLDQILTLRIDTSALDPELFFVDQNNLSKDTIEYHGVIPPNSISKGDQLS